MSTGIPEEIRSFLQWLLAIVKTVPTAEPNMASGADATAMGAVGDTTPGVARKHSIA
jgi:hypothetical protein